MTLSHLHERNMINQDIYMFRNFEAETLRREREEEANIVAEPVGYNRIGINLIAFKFLMK